jgi:Fe-S-cluster containining protein
LSATALQSVRALSIHADYRCRNSGVCCSSHWDVPVEVPIFRSLEEARKTGRLRTAPQSSSLEPFIVEPDLPDDAGAMLERNDDGECVFFDRGSHLCVVHRDLGHDALPATCRHFPRLAVRDGRGTSLSLSHYCPTAASLLFRDDAGLTIVDSPSAFPPGDYEGLSVAVDELPPLLKPAVAMDLDAYARWEAHMVRRCADDAVPESVLATLERDARLVRSWRPDGATMTDLIETLPEAPVEAAPPLGLGASLAVHAQTMLAVPDDLRPAPDEHDLDAAFERFVAPAWPVWSLPLRRYLAAKAFASWTAYQGRGLLTIVRGLEVALALVRVEAARECRDARRPLDGELLLMAIRRSDFILNHLAVGEDLASEWSKAETGW